MASPGPEQELGGFLKLPQCREDFGEPVPAPLCGCLFHVAPQRGVAAVPASVGSRGSRSWAGRQTRRTRMAQKTPHQPAGGRSRESRKRPPGGRIQELPRRRQRAGVPNTAARRQIPDPLRHRYSSAIKMKKNRARVMLNLHKLRSSSLFFCHTTGSTHQ